MRLIDADKLIGNIERDFCYPEAYKKMVEEQPTAYDVDKVVEDLEELKDVVDIDCCPYVGNDDMDCTRCYMEKAIGIVKSGGYQV